MNITKYIPSKVSVFVGRQLLVAQKNSPTLLFGAGVVGVVATVILSSRATLKLDEVLENTQKKLIEAEEIRSKGLENYSDQDHKKDVAIVYVQTAIKITKLYTPAFAVGVLSIASLAGSHHILTKRNASLVAAYTAIEKCFKEYRQRVSNEVGPDKERELRYGSKTYDIIDAETGKKKKVVRVNPDTPSMYSKIFDKNSKTWSPSIHSNLNVIRCHQNYANDQLRWRGHVLLNDVYDMFGFDRTQEGCVVGWVLNGDGDNVIDFNVFDKYLDKMDSDNFHMHDFVNGPDGSILIDFNVDGIVYDKI